MKAVWNNKVIAESDETVSIEGNAYFPPESVNSKYLRDSSTETFCPWKGKAGYYDIHVEGEINKDAAWFYKEPKKAAEKIKNHLAFWNGVEITE